MKSSIIRVMLTLTATGAIVAGSGDLSTASAAPSTSSWPLGLYVTCGPNYAVKQSCVAEAFGGSETGYTFTWETGKVTSEDGATSTATVNCPENSGYRYETVSVTDSNNGYVETQAQVWCSGW